MGGGWFHGEIIGRIDWPFNDQNFQSAVLKLVRYIILSVSIYRRDIHYQIFDIKMEIPGVFPELLFLPFSADRFPPFFLSLRESHSPLFFLFPVSSALRDSVHFFFSLEESSLSFNLI